MSGEEYVYPEGIDALLKAGTEMAGAELRTELLAHPEDGDVTVYVKRESDNEGGDRIVVAGDVMDALDARLPGPRHRRGTRSLTEMESLIMYVDRYKSDDTIAWAHLDGFRVEVVFDDHPAGPEGEAAWRQHRAMYTCPRSPEWQAWCAFDGKAMTQEQLGDFVEQRLEDLRGEANYPKPLEVLQMARHLVMHQKGTFERKIDPANGNGILINKLENAADSTVIPRAFLIGIPVFEGGTAYKVEARLRFAITEGRAVFSYTLHRRKEIERDAFNDVRKTIAERTKVPLLAGVP